MTGSFFPRLYDLVMTAADRGSIARYRRAVVQPAGGLVLEIGSGTGLNFTHYGPGATVVAVEPDAGMISRSAARARASVAAIRLVRGDAESLPFPAGVFDEAVVGLALCTIPSPTRALAELKRVVRCGGSVRLLEHVRLAGAVAGTIQDAISPLWSHLAGGCRLDRDTLRTIRESGLLVESVVPHWRRFVLEIVARVPARMPA